MQSSSRSNLRLAKWQWAVLVAGVIGLLVVTLVMPVIAQKRRRATFYPLAVANSKGPELLEKIGAPPGAKGATFRTVDQGPKRRTFADAGKAWVTWSHVHDTQQTFQEVLAWYTPRLAATGWKVHAPASTIGTAFCNAPWILEIKPAQPKAEGNDRSSRYELRLEWNNQFIAGSCKHP